jgi:asparagine synthase (glutamine-hydrolysing)
MFEVYGPGCLNKLNGMFAFAIYDQKENELFLARDRIGIKPLYYLDLTGRFLFASEAKSLLCYRDWSPDLNTRAIHDYLTLRYVPGHTAMFKQLKRLPAGHYLIYKKERVDLHRYWHIPQYHGSDSRVEEEYLEEFGDLLEKSVKRRLISEVPYGAYLSGGVDSAVIVALMSRLVPMPVKTFSVGFDYKHDELHDAAFTAKHLGCDHQEVQCRAEDIALLPKIVHYMDEPMGDAIIIPMYQLSRHAKKDVTVILTGEGGDEILGGYLFHKVMWAGNVYRELVPQNIRNRMIAPLLSICPPTAINIAFQYPAYLGNRGKQKVLDYLHLLEPVQLERAYRHLISLFDSRDTDELYSSDFKQKFKDDAFPDIPSSTQFLPLHDSYLNRLLHLQFDHWLPDNMLLRQDKTGMANGIEGRVPYLDHELVEFAFRLPPHFKIRRLVGKYILRKFAGNFLPKEVSQRKKMPFYVPIENHFQHPHFKDLMEELLSEDSVRRRGLFQFAAVQRLKAAMKRREFMLVKQVFSLMVLELWFRIFVDRTWRV